MRRRLFAILVGLALVIQMSVPAMAADTDPTDPEMSLSAQEYAALGMADLPNINVGEGDPMDGYVPTYLNELYFRSQTKSGRSRRLENDIDNLNKVPTDYIPGITPGEYYKTSSNILSTDDPLYYKDEGKESGDNHCQMTNTIAMTYGSEGKQVLVENALWYNDDSCWQELSTYYYSGSELVKSKYGVEYPISRDKDNDNRHWIADVTLREQMGLTSMATGDFNHDGKEDLAVYIPSGDATSAYIYFCTLEADEATNYYRLATQSELKIKLSDLNGLEGEGSLSRKFEFADEYYRTRVNLCKVSESGQDDLAVNLSFPYLNKDETCYPGKTAIYRYQDGAMEPVFKDDMIVSDDTSTGTHTIWRNQAAVEMDMNNDGVDELVIAGKKNENVDYGDDEGDIETGSDAKNLLNVILYDKNKGYYWAWSSPQEIASNPHIDIDNDAESSPITLAAGKFSGMSNSDVLFMEGRFVRSGCTLAGNSGITGGRFYITDVSGNSVDPLVENFGESRASCFIYKAIPGVFDRNNRRFEQLVVVAGCNGATGGDFVDLNLQVYTGMTAEDEDATKSKAGTHPLQLIASHFYFDDVNEDDNGSCLDICASNMDSDTMSYKYKGYSTSWSYPKVMAVLQSQPYWSELDYSGSNYTDVGATTTQTAASSYNYDYGITFGGSLSFLCGLLGNGGAVGFEASLAANRCFTHQDAYTTSETHLFRGNGTDDTVAIMAVPMVTYEYEVKIPAHKATADDVKQNPSLKEGDNVPEQTQTGYIVEQRQAIRNVLKVSEYNSVAQAHNDTVTKPEEKMTVIDLKEIFGDYTQGDPTTYPSSEEIYRENVVTNGWAPEDVTVYATDSWMNVSSSSASNVTDDVSNSTSVSDSRGYKVNGVLKGRIDFSGGWNFIVQAQVKGNVTFGGQGSGGQTWTTTDATGWKVATCYVPLPRVDTKDNGGYSKDYDYFSKTVEMVYREKTGVKDSEGNELYDQFPAIGYVVKTGVKETLPPSLPKDIRVSATTTDSITIGWTPNHTKTRPDATGYKVLYYSANDGKYIYLLDHSGNPLTIPADQNYCYIDGLKSGTGYSFKLQAYTDDVATVYSEAITARTKGLENEPEITGMPKDSNVLVGEVPSFTIEAQSVKDPSHGLIYQWQTLKDGSWTDVDKKENASAASATFYPAGYADGEGVAVTEEQAAKLDGTIYRCVVTDQITSTERVSTYSRCVYLNIGAAMKLSSLKLTASDNGMIHDGANVTFYGTLTGYEENAEGKKEEIPLEGEVELFVSNQSTGHVDIRKATTDASGKCSFDYTFSGEGTYIVSLASLKQSGYNRTSSDTLQLTVDNKAPYDIAYRCNGGTNNRHNPTSYITTESTVIKDPTRKGYTFEGWYLNPECTDDHYFDGIINAYTYTEKLTLYANWIPDIFNVYYFLNGGTYSNADRNSFTPEDASIELGEATREHSTFVGWRDLDTDEYIKTIDTKQGRDYHLEAVYQSEHDFVTSKVPAIPGKNGTITTSCSMCDVIQNYDVIYYPKTVKLSYTSTTYNGKSKKPSVEVYDCIGNLIAAENYTLTYPSDTTNAGTKTVSVTFKGELYDGTMSASYTIKKASPPLKITSTSFQVKRSKVKKQAVKVGPVKVSGVKEKAKKRFKKVSGSSRLKIDYTSGKITVKKGTKKGTYKIKVKVATSETKNYLKKSVKKTIKIKVK